MKGLCVGAGGVHKFEPRYDKVINPRMEKVFESNFSSKFPLGEGTLWELIQALKEDRYICDVCIYCGEIIKRP